MCLAYRKQEENVMRVRCANKASAEVRSDSGGSGALAKFLEDLAKSELFVGVAHSADQ